MCTGHVTSLTYQHSQSFFYRRAFRYTKQNKMPWLPCQRFSFRIFGSPIWPMFSILFFICFSIENNQKTICCNLFGVCLYIGWPRKCLSPYRFLLHIKSDLLVKIKNVKEVLLFSTACLCLSPDYVVVQSVT